MAAVTGVSLHCCRKGESAADMFFLAFRVGCGWGGPRREKRRMGRQFGKQCVAAVPNQSMDGHTETVWLADWLVAPLDRSTRAGGVRLCVGVCVCQLCQL